MVHQHLLETAVAFRFGTKKNERTYSLHIYRTSYKPFHYVLISGAGVSIIRLHLPNIFM